MDVACNYYDYYSHYWRAPVIKKGDLYDIIKKNIRPFDVIMFKGSSFISTIICEFERRGKKISKCGDFSHTGMIVTSDVIDEPLLEKGKLYILESTLGGATTDGVRDIHGNTRFGVQIRDFDSVVANYDVPDKSAISWCPIINNPIDKMPIIDVKKQMTDIYHQVDGKTYDYNIFDLASALIPILRPLRPYVDKIMHSEDLFFCSELVAHVFVEMGIYPDTVIPLNIVPDDLVHPEEDPDKCKPPVIINDINYMTTPVHSDRN